MIFLQIHHKILTILSLLVFSFLIIPFSSASNLMQSVSFSSFLNASSRPFWSLATAWIIFSCHVGLNETINKFLSHPFWIPLGRMGLSIYLVHPIVYNFIFTSRKEKISFQFHLNEFLVEIFTIFIFSSLFYLFIQEPVNQLTKILVEKLFKDENKKEN